MHAAIPLAPAVGIDLANIFVISGV